MTFFYDFGGFVWVRHAGELCGPYNSMAQARADMERET
jgi:hypothetical protein